MKEGIADNIAVPIVSDRVLLAGFTGA